MIQKSHPSNFTWTLTGSTPLKKKTPFKYFKYIHVNVNVQCDGWCFLASLPWHQIRPPSTHPRIMFRSSLQKAMSWGKERGCSPLAVANENGWKPPKKKWLVNDYMIIIFHLQKIVCFRLHVFRGWKLWSCKINNILSRNIVFTCTQSQIGNTY